MNILIIGGAGFIGCHLCEGLLREHAVVCLDNLSTGSRENIKQLLSNSRFYFIREDITSDLRAIKARLSNAEIQRGFDWVLNLASPASPAAYAKMPVETMLTGSAGTYNALELARAYNAGFLFTSTSEVYGDPEINPQHEGYFGNVNPIGARSVYDEAKRFSEALIMAYHRKFRLKTRIVRLFNTFGSRMASDDGRVVPTFITQALANKPITVFGSGKQTRSLCYVSDTVEGICAAITAEDKDEINYPINVGSEEELSIVELAKKIIKLSSSSSRIEFKDLPEDDPKVRRPDITRARKLLGWEPKVNVDEGLVKTIEWFRSKCSQ
ncbi:NAD-dependent dehydratase [Candidatus Woesearchaeota archaeon CG08_land_8_20_14_0_20_47_9]|nr:MAG: NAD-dependent dehydratase [Candidatus Woesearchaeota archaeon CG1_02_47_18]PIO03721.1 MAG: NAD-dependent dehydratase [Candidatus Woesearchaeota archaeon CG08_land_8_20_14_0_20_47_9]HII30132.1 NAD-dependent epimerase/dehydratase family protein [Candidatus Woesearchaeota archaeon]